MKYSQESLEQLDLFLNFFYAKKNLIPINNAIDELIKITNLEQGNVVMIIYKLETDEFLVRNKDEKQIMISFEGKLVKENGGYIKLQERNESERLKNIEDQLRLENLQTKTASLQKWIVIATVVAGLYYLIQILKFFELIPNYPLH